MTKPTQRRRHLLALALLCVAFLTAAAHAADTKTAADNTVKAPPGWELRNGAWVPLVPPGEGTPDAQVAQMVKDLAAGNTKKLIKDAKVWIKKNPKHPLMPQVLLLQGDAEVFRGNRYEALYSYEELVVNYPTSELYIHTLEREYNIADALLRGFRRKFLGLRLFSATEDAIELLDRIQDRQRGAPLAERAGLRVADYYYEVGKFPEAADSYSDFLKRYPYSQYVRKAEIRRAESSLANFRGILFDFTPLYDAREQLATISENYKQSSLELQTRAVDDRIYQLEGAKELEIARYYWRAGRKHAAAFYYKRVKENWPGTTWANEARTELSRRIPEEASK